MVASRCRDGVVATGAVTDPEGSTGRLTHDILSRLLPLLSAACPFRYLSRSTTAQRPGNCSIRIARSPSCGAGHAYQACGELS